MTARWTSPDIGVTRDRIQGHIIGRERELELVLAAVAAGRDVVIEGPPGTSKTTLLKAIAHEWGIPLILVEGNADLTPSKLIGHHNPARVLREDYSPDNFVDGPLVEAMRRGGFLYIEEFNRAPDDTLNTLLMAMADRMVAIPRVGTVHAEPSFRVIASMNPFDNVGTSRLPASIHDRICRLAIDYQDEAAERAIVTLRTGSDGQDDGVVLGDGLVADAVAVTRATRVHDHVRQGSSVRGAIDCVLVARQLAVLRDVRTCDDGGYPPLVLDSMIMSLSGRIHLDESLGSTPEAVLEEIWDDHFVLRPATAAPG